MDEQRPSNTGRPHVQGPLSAGEARFRAVVDGFSDPILILDAYAMIRYVNAEFLTFFGYTLADVIGTPFDELLPADERPAVLARLAESRPASGAPLRFEHLLRRRDGTEEIVETSANTLSDPSGEPTTILHLRVITGRKRAEETLRASEERYRDLVENSHDLIQTFAPDGRLLFVNRTWLQTLEYAEDELPRLTLWDIVHPDARTAYEHTLAQLWQSRNPGMVRTAFVTKYGATVEVEGVAVVQLEEGRPVAASAFCRDVTAQRESERILAARFAVTRILAASPGLTVALAETVVAIGSTMNWHAAELWLPDPSGDVLRWQAGWHRPDLPELAAFLEGSKSLAFRPHEGLPGQIWATGEVRWEARVADSDLFQRRSLALRAGIITAVGAPIKQDSEMAGVMVFLSRSARAEEEAMAAILVDLGRQLGQFASRKAAEADLETERASLARRVEERTADLSRVNAALAQALRAKDEFLATMSHELRTPLNTILAVSEVLLEELRGPLNPSQQASLRAIETAGHHLLALISDILDLSKVEAGQLELRLEPVVVADICQASLLFVKELAVKKQLQLSFHLSDQLAIMDADAKRLKQMLVNLLSNAVKFTPVGGKVSLEVTVQPEAGSIVFAVADSGIGIAREDQARLFQPFTQVDSSLSRQHEGTGLGLALVWRLAELHGGSIGVESEPGQGSRFTLALPYRSAMAVTVEPAARAVSIVAPTEGGAQATALIVDDAESAAEQLARYLEAMNLRAVLHPQGEGVLELALQLQPRVILLDLLMADKSGWEILALLKADPRTRAIPVIIVSVVDEQAKGLAAGAAAYLVKPLGREALRAALQAASVAETSAPALVDAPRPTGAQTRARILLAEDNEGNIEVVGDYLRHHGYQVEVARDGREALDSALAAPPDLILLDIQMPVLNGLEVARHLRSLPLFAATPIIALTALAMPGDRERSLAAGATAYMTKPVSPRALVDEIQRLLGA